MTQETLRTSLIIVLGFLALTAIAGGVGLLTGVNAPSPDLLQGSPFKDFSVPGLTLLLVVGGSALVAFILMIRRQRYAPIFSAAAGLIIILFEVIEVLVIGSPPGVARNLQAFYLIFGWLIITLAIVQRIAEHRAKIIE